MSELVGTPVDRFSRVEAHKGCYKILYNRFGINNQDEWSYNILYIMSYLMVEGKRLK